MLIKFVLQKTRNRSSRRHLSEVFRRGLHSEHYEGEAEECPGESVPAQPHGE